MAGQPGTLETIARQIAAAMLPLEQRLTPDQFPAFITELGLNMPGPVASFAAVASGASSTVSAVVALPPLIVDLETAISGDDTDGILSAGIKLVAQILNVIRGIADMASAISSAAAPLSAADRAKVEAFAAELPERLFDYTVVEYLRSARPGALRTLSLAGLIDDISEPGDPTDPLSLPWHRRTLRIDRLRDLVTAPDKYFKDAFGWNDPAFDGTLLFQRVHAFLAQYGLPVVLLNPPGGPPALEAFFLRFESDTSVSPPGLTMRLRLPAIADFQQDYGLSEIWGLHLDAGARFDAGLEVHVRPPLQVAFLPPTGSAQAELAAGIFAEKKPGPMLLLGEAGGNGLLLQRFELDLGVKGSWESLSSPLQVEPTVAGEVKGGQLKIDLSQGDGFIAKLASGVNLNANFDLAVAWSPSSGIRFQGSCALELVIPTHISLGPIDVENIYLVVGIGTDLSIPIELSGALSAVLGPLEASVDRIGLMAKLTFPDNGQGNLGKANIDFSFKPPNGVGLAINAGVVIGGGYLYFDPDKGEYAGVAELSIADVVTVRAIALITTKMPDGSNGFSLLLIITTDFPPIQLSFGFTLNGVGGVLGLNRAVLLDVLRDGVRTGAVDDIMFPTDVIANAPRIISDLKAVFPPQEGTFLVGPMAKVGWGTPSLITLSLGIILEIPPGNIAILGVLKVALPTDDETLIQIQVNFIGILDFDEQLLSFDASLFDSHILFMTLEGDMAVRLKWGDNATFLISVGGFHPLFKPPDGLHLPATLKRLGITILDYDWAKIRVDSYFAVTSNTVQFGAHLYLFFGVDGANINGQLGLDVLFQFSPFYFIAQISGSLSISVAGFDLLSIDLRFSLEGPSPWRAKGTGSISICWFLSVDVSFDVTWGDAKDTTLPPVDVLPIFLAEMNKQENWKALPPPSTNLLVALRKIDPALLILHPFGELTLSQRALPLNLTLDKVGNEKPDDVNRVDITTVASGGTSLPLSDHNEQFATAQYQNMSDNDKLSRPSYQDLKGGVVIGTAEAAQSSKMTRRAISYSVTIIDKEPQKPLPRGKFYPAIAGLFHPFLSGAAAARSTLSYQLKSQLRPYSDKIAVGQEGYTVSNTSDNKPFNSASRFSSEAMARDYMNSQMQGSPALVGSIHVLPGSEVNAS